MRVSAMIKKRMMVQAEEDVAPALPEKSELKVWLPKMLQPAQRTLVKKVAALLENEAGAAAAFSVALLEAVNFMEGAELANKHLKLLMNKVAPK